MFKVDLDFSTVSGVDLGEKLRKFYCEAKPKDVKKRENSMTVEQAAEYNKNTLKNIRAAINRKLCDVGRDLDIVRDKEFKSANKALDGLMKTLTKTGASRATQHKAILVEEDVKAIAAYFAKSAKSSPIVLRQAVWYLISIHFVTRGLEFHHQMLLGSIKFCKDKNNREYMKLEQEVQEKNHQGGINNEESQTGKRIYESGDVNCPIGLIKYFLSKQCRDAKYLFNGIVKEAISHPAGQETWFNDKPLGKTTFSNFMTDICKYSHTTQRYTAHCLRATAIQAMNDAGFETRHIMSMSGHRCESSLKHYNRRMSETQKESVSGVMSALTSGMNPIPLPIKSADRRPAIKPADPILGQSLALEVGQENTKNNEIAIPTMTQSNWSSVMQSSGFLTSSTFNSCTFNFGGK